MNKLKNIAELSAYSYFDKLACHSAVNREIPGSSPEWLPTLRVWGAQSCYYVVNVTIFWVPTLLLAPASQEPPPSSTLLDMGAEKVLVEVTTTFQMLLETNTSSQKSQWVHLVGRKESFAYCKHLVSVFWLETGLEKHSSLAFLIHRQFIDPSRFCNSLSLLSDT